MKKILVLFTLLLSLSSFATTYYIAYDGNDSNNGTTINTPIKSINKLSTIFIQPGDQIYFKRGGNYPGQINLNVEVTISDYGIGNNPVINGSIPISNWTIHTGNIYKTNITGNVKYLFANKKLQQLARYPNSGWARAVTTTTTQLSSNEIIQPSGYWNGGTLVIRNTHFSYENKLINSHTGNNINFPALIYYSGGDHNWGFYLCNKLEALDSPGEWYHDINNGVLYYWPISNINLLEIEASNYDYGVFVPNYVNNTLITNLDFKGQRVAGVNNYGSNIQVTNCNFYDLYHGIYTSTGSNNLYDNNTFKRTYASALAIFENNSVISNNELDSIAYIGGLGEPVFGYFGMRIGGATTNPNIVRNNKVIRAGNSGIFLGEKVIAENNYIKDFCITLNDGGGIYFDNLNNSIVNNNVVDSYVGNLENTATNYGGVTGIICPGIYFGNAVIQNNTIKNNTITNCSIGLLLDHTMVTESNIVEFNNFFDNDVQIILTDLSNSNSTVQGNVLPYYRSAYNEVVRNNNFYSLSPNSLIMEIFNWYGESNVDWGTFQNNKLFNPFNPLIIRNWKLGTTPQTVKTYTLNHWKQIKNEEVGSIDSPIFSTQYKATSVLSSNLIDNGTFDNTLGWTCYPSSPDATIESVNSKMLVNLVNGPEHYVYNQNSFNLTNGWYKLKFDLQSSINGVVYLQIKEEQLLTSGEFIFNREFAFNENNKTYEVYFQSNVNSPSKILFTSKISEPTYSIDNLELYKVNVEEINLSDYHKLIYNITNTTQIYDLEGQWKKLNGDTISTLQLTPFSSEIVYKVIENEAPVVITSPNIQDSNIQFSGFTNSAMTVTWTLGDGESRILVLNNNNNFINPVNGLTYTANSTWNNTGQQVVYSGKGNGVRITGLTSGVNYYARIYSYNGDSLSTSYNISNQTGNVILGQNMPAQQLNMQSSVSTNSSVLVKAIVNNNPPSITLQFKPTNGTSTGWVISRKLKNATSWTNIATLSGTSTQYVDNNVSVGVYYEYKIQKGNSSSNVASYIATGIEVQPVDYRGKMILLVDQTFSSLVEINQLVEDLTADGWIILRNDISRTSTVSNIKSLITSLYNSDNTIKAVYLIGHLAVPYSGRMAPDGHTSGNCDHIGAWPSDGYYGEINGVWTDNTVNQNCSDNNRNINIPGDGKFDQNIFPSSLELEVGRIDVYDMPSYGTIHTNPSSEVNEMKKYLNKAHEWKIKKFTSPERAVVNDGFTTQYGFAVSGWTNFGSLVGSENILPFVGPVSPWPFQNQTSNLGQLWSITTNGGLKTSPSGGKDLYKYNGTFADYSSTESYASVQFNSIFNMVVCSYAGDWDGTDNFLKGIVMSGRALSAVWAFQSIINLQQSLTR